MSRGRNRYRKRYVQQNVDGPRIIYVTMDAFPLRICNTFAFLFCLEFFFVREIPRFDGKLLSGTCVFGSFRRAEDCQISANRSLSNRELGLEFLFRIPCGATPRRSNEWQKVLLLRFRR